MTLEQTKILLLQQLCIKSHYIKVLPEKSVKTVLRCDRPSEKSLTCCVRARMSSWSTGPPGLPGPPFWLLLRFVRDMLLVIFCWRELGEGALREGALPRAPGGTVHVSGPWNIDSQLLKELVK